MKVKVYLSGPISGMPDDNRKAFADAAQDWSMLGYDVVNPLDNARNHGLPWEQCLRNDLVWLLGCDAIAMLEGWMDSRGARLEHFVARQLSMPVFSADTQMELTVPSMYEPQGLYIEPESEKPITEIAHNIVSGARREAYGHPFDNASKMAQCMSPILGIEITPEQAMLCMLAIKLARLTHTPDHRDSLIDLAGYAEVLDIIRQRRAENARA